MVLQNLLYRYIQVVVYSLGLALLMRISMELINTALPSSLSSMSSAIEWGLLTVILTMSVRLVSRSTFGLMTGSFGAFRQSLRSSLGVQNGPGVVGTLTRVAGGAAIGGLLTGGPGAILGALGGFQSARAQGGRLSNAAIGAGAMAGMSGNQLDAVAAPGNVFMDNGRQAQPASGAIASASAPADGGMAQPAAMPGGAAPPSNLPPDWVGVQTAPTAAGTPGFVAESDPAAAERQERLAEAVEQLHQDTDRLNRRGGQDPSTPASAPPPSPTPAGVPRPDSGGGLTNEATRRAMDQARIFTPDNPPGGTE